MNIFEQDFFTPKSDTFFLFEDTTIRQALEKFDYHKFSVVPVIKNDGQYLTTISEGDILRYIKNEAGFDIHKAENVYISEIEKYRPYSPCRHNVSLEEIFGLALEQNFVPIVDDRFFFIGIVKRNGILRYLHKMYDSFKSEKE